jgi:hypothetical protein
MNQDDCEEGLNGVALAKLVLIIPSFVFAIHLSISSRTLPVEQIISYSKVRIGLEIHYKVCLLKCSSQSVVSRTQYDKKG